MRLQGKHVTVFGLNRSGVAAARLLHTRGSVVTLTDTRTAEALAAEIAELNVFSEPGDIQKYLGGHPTACIAAADFIVVSPGIPLDIPILCEARAQEIPILAELEVAARVCPAPIVAITGTKGKSTTALLTAAMLKESERFTQVCVAGNIGVPLAAEVRNLTDRDIVVVEASSFQLETTVTFHPVVSVVLNFSRDHLDRHGTMSTYRKAKQKIATNQTSDDWMVLNGSDASVKDFAASTAARVVYFTDKALPENPPFAGVFKDGSGIFAQCDGVKEKICDIAEIPLPGAHNLQNILAAATVARVFEITGTQVQAALRNFDRSHPALAHAFEPVRTLNDIAFVDDSKATNVAAVKAALESIQGQQVILIMGGYDKGNDYTPLAEIVRDRVKAAVMLGEYTQQIEKTLADTTEIVKAKTMEEAVQIAYRYATADDVVLLSPANASFDMYTDYKARGTAFKEAVQALQCLN